MRGYAEASLYRIMSKTLPLSPYSPEYKGISTLNIIYEAGLDSESRPILVLCASNLPDPETINYDLILAFIIARLDEFVENDYVLVFFSSPAQYRPPWLWLLKAYRTLDRKYKKNLKALYVVHLARTYRIIFDLANKITSPKFARKLHYLSSLDELHESVQLSPQFIPEQVKTYDRQLNPSISTSLGRRQSAPSAVSLVKRSLPSLAFGLTLDRLAKLELDQQGQQAAPYIPKVVRCLVEHLRQRGLDEEGLFRKSPSSEELKRVKEAFNQGVDVDLSQHDIHVSASLLKVFLRELGEPLITVEFCSGLGKLPANPDHCSNDVIQRVQTRIRDTYATKPHELSLMRYLFDFLDQVTQHANKNRMNHHNLALVFAPNIIREAQSVSQPTPSTQKEAVTTASLYLKQMNEAMILVQLLIAKHETLLYPEP